MVQIAVVADCKLAKCVRMHLVLSPQICKLTVLVLKEILTQITFLCAFEYLSRFGPEITQFIMFV